MRPIKYRAWAKRNEFYIENIQDAYDGAGPHDPFDCFGDALDNDDYVVEQYTEMKDLYGTEIYEGDIIQVQETMDNGRLVCLSAVAKVYYDEDYGQWRCDGGFTGPLSEHANTASGSFINSVSDDYMPNRCEVIGNIHENPELMEADK
ncbi:hypothetical protein IWT140_01736 [Secundilactobacillus pentosiphilus]|uniref:YopX protein domain-containing protein n=1 Tax=Secundilactobacillus pentosiphilus TaxID=1714682 RepID=A0A1Z5IQT5_9LACO|nr:YopX family protein [Secundilactobacillus pentosiphilus]GAX04099.1 hypothetical protein IWT140_01736 [Secundilactobacillus pentosiphilus]